MKKAFITGITGQDGSYLAELLLEKGYEVHGIIRRASVFNTERIDHLMDDIYTYHGDLTDSSNLSRLIEKIQPDEVYNLGAQSHVKVSFDVPEYTAEVDGIGAIKLLDAIKGLGVGTKYYQASTSELFGGFPDTVPQNENTPFMPRSPYAAAKLYAYWITVNFREAYNLFACNGILFNHESERRGRTFVTRKITAAVAEIVKGKRERLTLGNLDSKRDWGYAKDYVHGMWMMMQYDTPDDYVIATGEAHSVREFVEEAFSYVDINIEWQGNGLDERGIDSKTGKLLIEINPKFFRPTEVDFLLGDATKIKDKLGFVPKTSFKELVKIMMEHDLNER